MPLNKRVEYCFRVAVGIGGMTKVLADFLKDRNTLLTEKEKMVNAAAAFWLPFALLHKGDYSQALLQQSAREAIYKLRMHINYIAETFGLENPDQTLIPVGSITTTKEATVAHPYPPLTQLSISADETANQVPVMIPSTSVEYEAEDMIHHHDDEALENIFS
ncbi:hypothetical protein H6G76_29225 [Nostoc sp. FACHB-152]|uniref:hypothetical protein n=1 Tax=unclassified Nostoc TaxID=2593658 RepID=UPI001689E21D|nr:MULTISPECIES: hypothetical protein [unclassified Nostoc]MBD2451141.1 hypothetical protein [Nostoc sp. FACHB-152]MBD2473199.1 hypothetical protein [Nostoc sp. FACHB-145]